MNGTGNMFMRRFLPLFLVVVLIVLLLPIIAKWFSTQEEPPVSALPVIEEGGKLSIKVRKKTVVILLDTVEIAAREDLPNSTLVLYGDRSFMRFNVEANLLHADDDLYRSLVDRKMLITFPFNASSNAKINLGDLGPAALLLGSNLVLKSYERGRGNRVRWKGDAEMFVQTSEGPLTLTGAFSFGASPRATAMHAS